MVANNKYILLCGPTGVGKTSLLDGLHEYFGSDMASYVDPFVNNPFIHQAYADGSKSFQSQLFFFKEFIKLHKSISNDEHKLIVQERSIFESVYIFCKSLYLSGVFNLDEYNLFEDLLSEVSEKFRVPDLVINLDASASTILKRIKYRGRDFEQDLNYNFIERQRSLYSDFIAKVRINQFSKIETICTESLTKDEALSKGLPLIGSI